MQTIKLKMSNEVYNKVLELLLQFGDDDVEIISDQDEFNETKAFLHKEFDEMKSGDAEFYDINEADEKFEKTINSHENKA
jgi:hypothetical protein